MRLGFAVKVLGERGMDFDVMLEAKAKVSRCCACVSSSPTGSEGEHERDPDRRVRLPAG
jgi:hypothetical protein